MDCVVSVMDHWEGMIVGPVLVAENHHKINTKDIDLGKPPLGVIRSFPEIYLSDLSWHIRGKILVPCASRMDQLLVSKPQTALDQRILPLRLLAR